VPGTHSLSSQHIDSCKKEFNKIRREKLKKGYTVLEMQKIEVEEEKDEEKKESKSALHPKLQTLMEFIFNMKNIETSVAEIGYDPKKMPLGNLSDDMINKGFEILSNIQKELDSKNKSHSTLSELSS